MTNQIYLFIYMLTNHICSQVQRWVGRGHLNYEEVSQVYRTLPWKPRTNQIAALHDINQSTKKYFDAHSVKKILMPPPTFEPDPRAINNDRSLTTHFVLPGTAVGRKGTSKLRGSVASLQNISLETDDQSNTSIQNIILSKYHFISQVQRLVGKECLNYVEVLQV